MDIKKTTSVTIDRETASQIDRLSTSFGMSKKEFLASSMEYFEKYGINPGKHDSASKEMNKIVKRMDQIAALMKAQERDLFRPMVEAMAKSEERIRYTMQDVAKGTEVKSDLVKVLQGLSSIGRDLQQVQITEEKTQQALERGQRREFELLRSFIAYIQAKDEKSLFGKNLNELYTSFKQEIR